MSMHRMSRRWMVVVGLGSALALPTAASAQAPQKAPAAKTESKKPATTQRVKLNTSLGEIVVELNAEKAPKSVANFIQYTRDKHYDGTVFHRVIGNFMIQGGGFTPSMEQKPTRAPIPIESDNGLSNARGTIAMARTGDPNSATSQFFINVVDNTRLDKPSFDGFGYTVFGKVVSGMEVVDKIREVQTGNAGPHQNVPTTPVVIQSATLEK
jgi:peptidyl-prolyl cis-trans isomerase A (cyclophilin A)